MKTQPNINEQNPSLTPTRGPETDIVKGASDTSQIDAAKANAQQHTDAATSAASPSLNEITNNEPNNGEEDADNANPSSQQNK